MKLVLATRNTHKLREFERLLPGHDLVRLPADVELPPEDADSFAGNAVPKAMAAAAATGLPAIADDSGIEADALDGAPGVRSARFAGEKATDKQNLQKLLDDVPVDGDRDVRYVCAVAYVPGPGEPPLVFEGVCRGTLATEPRGSGGFGYDPAFVPSRHPGKTMAELDDAQKDAISHRGHAARAFGDWVAGEGTD